VSHLLGSPGAGLEEAPQLVGGEVPATGVGLSAEGIHVDREVVLLSAQ
jgi:hypothetical protein